MFAYTSLNQAEQATGNPAYHRGTTLIWYMNEEGWRLFSTGPDFAAYHGDPLPTPETLPKTHVLLGAISETELERIFYLMQGDVWSPEGNARELIRSKGLRHTSMSVGDVVQRGKKLWMVAGTGFEQIAGPGSVDIDKMAAEVRERMKKYK